MNHAHDALDEHSAQLDALSARVEDADGAEALARLAERVMEVSDAVSRMLPQALAEPRPPAAS